MTAAARCCLPLIASVCCTQSRLVQIKEDIRDKVAKTHKELKVRAAGRCLWHVLAHVARFVVELVEGDWPAGSRRGGAVPGASKVLASRPRLSANCPAVTRNGSRRTPSRTTWPEVEADRKQHGSDAGGRGCGRDAPDHPRRLSSVPPGKAVVSGRAGLGLGGGGEKADCAALCEHSIAGGGVAGGGKGTGEASSCQRGRLPLGARFQVRATCAWASTSRRVGMIFFGGNLRGRVHD